MYSTLTYIYGVQRDNFSFIVSAYGIFILREKLVQSSVIVHSYLNYGYRRHKGFVDIAIFSGEQMKH
jgi:hypothetical protein